jgi:polysaccharide pyruvyl transferase WcaK-like protein
MGGGNLGDDTTQTAVMGNIRSRWPGAIIYGFSMNPPDTRLRHGIASYPVRRKTWDHPDRHENVEIGPGDKLGTPRQQGAFPGLRRLIRAVAFKIPHAIVSEVTFLAKSLYVMRTLDVFVISGGGQLLDSWGGPWAYPYTIFKWISLARLAGTKCYLVNVGAGPLTHPLSKFFIRHALALANYVSFRDSDSMSLVRGIGFKGEAHVYPDCVYALEMPSIPRIQKDARNGLVVGMSPMAYCDPRRYWIQDQGAYEAFVRKLVVFGAWLTDRHRLTLFSTDIWFDSQTLVKVDKALKSETHTNVTHLLIDTPVAIATVETLLSQMSTMDYVITCRFHGVIFAHLMNIPVIALSHHPKVSTLMADLGLSEYCIDIDTFDVEQLTATFTRLVADRVAIKVRMAEKAAFYKSALTTQFDQLFSPEVIR